MVLLPPEMGKRAVITAVDESGEGSGGYGERGGSYGGGKVSGEGDLGFSDEYGKNVDLVDDANPGIAAREVNSELVTFNEHRGFGFVCAVSSVSQGYDALFSERKT